MFRQYIAGPSPRMKFRFPVDGDGARSYLFEDMERLRPLRTVVTKPDDTTVARLLGFVAPLGCNKM